MKRYKFLNKILVVCIIIFTFLLLIKINVINTRALSPLGNTNENYKKVKEEFGEEFSNFIKDNSIIKIYNEKKDILVKVGDTNFKIDSDWSVKNIKNQVNEIFSDAKEKIEEIIYG